MAKSKTKATPIAATAAATSPRAEKPEKSTAGFYKKSGDRLLFAPTAVYIPKQQPLLVAEHDKHTYPVEGWTYYDSAEAAYAAEGLEMPAPVTRQSIAEKIAARRAMTPEQKEAERTQRETERIARLQEKHPERAAQLQARMAQRQERLAKRAAMAAMSPEDRRAARRAEIESKHPELAAKRAALQAQRAERAVNMSEG